MILKLFSPSDEDTAVHQLPEPDMVVDPRPIGDWAIKLNIAVNGTTLTFTIINREEDEDSDDWPPMRFRVYSRNEFHYSFKSRKYLYHGIEEEFPPHYVREIVIKDGVKTIRRCAFAECRSLSKITIPNTVTGFDDFAFKGCESLQYIQLPPNLQYIGKSAFNGDLFEAIYIPPTVTRIDDNAFLFCPFLRIMNIPDSVQYIGYNMLRECYGLVTDESNAMSSNEEYHEWIRNRYNPLHNLCWDPSVTANNIQQYIQQHHDGEERATTKDKPQFTPLHLLGANPSVTGDMITAYLQLAPDVATIQDNEEKTPLHMLCSAPSCFDGTGSAIEAYLGGCNEGKRAALMKNDEGRTPFDYLCKKNVDELLFLKNKTFAGLMVWWYDHCLGISLFAEDIDKENRKRKYLA